MGAVRDDCNRTRPADVQGALRQGAQQIWTSIENTSHLLRVMVREPEALDDMLDTVCRWWLPPPINGLVGR